MLATSKLNYPRKGFVIIRRQFGCEFLEGGQLVFLEVVPFVLGEAVNEEGAYAGP